MRMMLAGALVMYWLEYRMTWISELLIGTTTPV